VNGLKLLFLSTKATRPSHRFRVEQMLPHLERRGHHCSVAFFPKNPVARCWFYRRLAHFDAVIIQQRTLDPFELKLVRHLSARLVFDVDDAVMFDGRGHSDARRERRFAAMVNTADLVICGNRFLRSQVEKQSGKLRSPLVAILPTAINTDRFRPGLVATKPGGIITIGWTGSRSTNPYLNTIFPALSNLRGTAELKIMSDTTDGLDFSQLGDLPHRFVKWSAGTEVAETAEFDIGLMPLPDDNSTRGKCGCKALQYMALGIPAVCGPVGVNCDIIQHGANGFLPDSPTQWTDTLDRLIADPELRQQIGQAGRATVESGYSLSEVVIRLALLLEDVPRPLIRAA
jgi:glycosyltransferase involved in cell wall biosynthesis